MMELTQAIDLWFHYEAIAMHFNQLIMQFRLQLLGGTGALGSILAYLITQHVDNTTLRHSLYRFISAGLLVIFSAAACLYVFYYAQLLEGSIAAILELEAQYEEISFSTTITDRLAGSATKIIYGVYSSVILFFIAAAVYFWRLKDTPQN